MWDIVGRGASFCLGVFFLLLNRLDALNIQTAHMDYVFHLCDVIFGLEKHHAGVTFEDTKIKGILGDDMQLVRNF